MASKTHKTFEDFMYEIHLLTPNSSNKKKTTKSASKRDPYGKDPEQIRREIEAKTQKESIHHTDRAAASDAANQARKKAKHRQKPLRPGEVKTYDSKTKTYKSNLPSAQESPKPLRRGEVRKFNRETGKWESNLS